MEATAMELTVDTVTGAADPIMIAVWLKPWLWQCFGIACMLIIVGTMVMEAMDISDLVITMVGDITITILIRRSTGTRFMTRVLMCLLMVSTLMLSALILATLMTLVTMKLSTMVQVARNRRCLMAVVQHHIQHAQCQCFRTSCQCGCPQSAFGHHAARVGHCFQRQHRQRLEEMVVHHLCLRQKLLQHCVVPRKRPSEVGLARYMKIWLTTRSATSLAPVFQLTFPVRKGFAWSHNALPIGCHGSANNVSHGHLGSAQWLCSCSQQTSGLKSSPCCQRLTVLAACLVVA
mmetsp:Transcript_96585/g.191439  ORF Transcript_96585/g.191439 Transcript_96585/m.191439 type:complete len:290 (-) Transcript_96585:322-1191(-)